MTEENIKRDLIFNDPRLAMTLAGRMAVRIAGWIGYAVLCAAILVFVLSDITPLRAIGVLLVLFLVDYLMHRADPELLIAEAPSRGFHGFLARLPRERQINVAQCISPRAFRALESAFDRAALLHTSFPLEIVRELLKTEGVRHGLLRLDVPLDELKKKLDEFLAAHPEHSASKEERIRIAEVLACEAFRASYREGHSAVEAEDFFAALPVLHDEYIMRLFRVFAIQPEDLSKALLFGRTNRARAGFLGIRFAARGKDGLFRRVKHKVMNRAWTARPTPVLDSISNDLTDLARRGEIGFLVGHTREYERLVDALSRPANPNALLVGDAGMGKRTIVSHLALRITQDKVPNALFDTRLVELSLGALVAGQKEAALQERLRHIVEEITLAGNIILYIPDMHDLMKTSGTEYLSAADALSPIIMDNRFPVVGATYPREFKQYIEPRSDFVSSFEVIHVEEITTEEAEKILVYEGLVHERRSNVIISFTAIKTAVALAKKYLHEKFLPGSAMELLRDAVQTATKEKKEAVSREDVVREAERKVNVPIHETTEAESQSLLHLETLIHSRYVNQDEAVSAVANALREYRSGLSRKGGPIATFLFVGPTGVGKTELAKLLAEIQFGSIHAMIRFDMSEYQHVESLSRLIGRADGTSRGILTDAIREKPYSLILLDEFEKAHADILNLFLQVFDDGRLTDSMGRVVDFQNTIIIATSNAHSDMMVDALRKGASITTVSELVKERLTDVFHPELLNRFSRVVVFRDLNEHDVRRVAELNVQELTALLREQGIAVTFDDAVVSEIARWGYDPVFGARPLRRVIEEKIRAPLAEKILRKEIASGGSLRVVLKDNELGFVIGVSTNSPHM